MKFDDIDTRRLLPHWAHDADWIQAAFDKIAKAAFERTPAIDVPLTMQAIRTLSDSELQAWYERLGVVEYYPDLSRETREKMLFWCARLYKFLGTPQAVRILCEYVHDGLPMNVDVRDNLGWDGTTLVDPQLLDAFDIAIDAEDVHITPMLANRIVQNVLRIARNPQALRNIIYRYTTQIDVPVSPADAPSAAVTEFVENWAVSAPQMPMVWRYDEDVLPFETVAPGGVLATGLQYSASKLYAPVVAINDPMAITPDYYGWSIAESAGDVAIVNDTGATKSVMVVTIYHMEATEDAEIVTVKNGQNAWFNAFKVYKNGDPWWFVIGYAIDGWTDDLAAEGYEEVSPVPVVGDIITFGSYPQSTSTPEPIEWIVLDVDTENQMALLISKYLLASRQFSNSYSPRWWNCTLRTWLNDSFLNSAFNADELSQIALMSVNTEGVIRSNYIFLLSVDEASGYFANDTARLGVATQAAINEGIYHTNEWYCPWWLRSTATSSPNDFATFVESDGTIHADGYYMTDKHFGVRPVLWMQYQ